MKIINFLFVPVFFLMVNNSFSQDKIKYEQLYLVWNNHAIKFSDIKPSTIVQLLGKPIRIEKERSEVTDKLATTYIYANGE